MNRDVRQSTRRPVLAFIALYGLMLVDSMSISVVIPIIEPALLDETHPIFLPDWPQTQRAWIFGALMGIPSFLVLYMSPVLAGLSDSIGRRKVLIVAALGIAFANLLTAFALLSASLVLLFLARILAGLTAAGQPTAQAALVDLTTDARRPFHLTMSLLAISLGFVLGPLLAAAFLSLQSQARWEEEIPFYILGGAAIVFVVLIVVRYRDERAVLNQFQWETLSLRQGIGRFRSAFTHRNVRGLLGIFLIMQIGWASFFIFSPGYLRESLSFSKFEVSIFSTWIGVGLCLANGLVQPFLIRYVPFERIAFTGLVTTAAVFVVSLFLDSQPIQFGLAMTAGITSSVAYASIVTMLSLRVDRSKQGWILGMAGATVALAWGVASLLGGWLDNFDFMAPLIAAGVAFSLSGLLFLPIVLRGNPSK